MTFRRIVVSSCSKTLIRTIKAISMTLKKGVGQIALLEMVVLTLDRALSVKRALVIYTL